MNYVKSLQIEFLNNVDFGRIVEESNKDSCVERDTDNGYCHDSSDDYLGIELHPCICIIVLDKSSL